MFETWNNKIEKSNRCQSQHAASVMMSKELGMEGWRTGRTQGVDRLQRCFTSKNNGATKDGAKLETRGKVASQTGNKNSYIETTACSYNFSPSLLVPPAFLITFFSPHYLLSNIVLSIIPSALAYYFIELSRFSLVFNIFRRMHVFALASSSFLYYVIPHMCHYWK